MEQAVTSSFNGWMICAVYYFRAQSDDGQRVRLCDIVTLFYFICLFFFLFFGRVLLFGEF